jgi:hypothetical protein
MLPAPGSSGGWCRSSTSPSITALSTGTTVCAAPMFLICALDLPVHCALILCGVATQYPTGMQHIEAPPGELGVVTHRASNLYG